MMQHSVKHEETSSLSALENLLHDIASRARSAYAELAQASTASKRACLIEAAAMLRAQSDAIITANKEDMTRARAGGLSASMLDRLELNAQRVEAMAAGVEGVAHLPDPVGITLEAWDVAHNGLHIEKRSIPLGVIGIIYESRPNVTADAAALCILSGNAAILRGGSESLHSSTIIVEILRAALAKNALPADAVQLIPVRDREAVGIMLSLTGLIDVIIPRGGKSLTERIQRESRIATILHLDGVCHSYIHRSADKSTAERVVLNAKMRRTGVCGATETLLLDKHIAAEFLPLIADALSAAGCALRGDKAACALDGRIAPANEEDWSCEYLDAILSIKIVAHLQEAVAHINHYGSHHTDAIIATDAAAIAQFTSEVDSAIVLSNASTQFADGGEFGFGAEIGISTGRLHARGPVGAQQLTTYKYIVSTKSASGAVRP